MTVFYPHLFIHLSVDVDGEETLSVDHAVRLALHYLAISIVITAHMVKTFRIMVTLGSDSKNIPMIQLLNLAAFCSWNRMNYSSSDLIISPKFRHL